MSDWPARDFGVFHSGERRALREFARFRDFEPLSKHPRIGLASLRSLCTKGFAQEGPSSIYGPTFRLTAGGRMAARTLDNRPPRPKSGLSLDNVEIGLAKAEELELIVLADGRRAVVRLSVEDARELARELRDWAEGRKAKAA
jgi:hypothetical protein